MISLNSRKGKEYMQTKFDKVSEGDRVENEEERFVVKYKFGSVLILDWLDRKNEKPYVHQLVFKEDFNKNYKIIYEQKT